MTFDYNGIANSELEAARCIAAAGRVVEHRFVRLPDLKEASGIAGFALRNRPPTYIPMKNAIFYSFAAAYAEEVTAATIVGGHNKDDLEVFDDVSPKFFSALQRALLEASPVLRERGLRILRPLGRERKPSVIRLAVALGVPLESTWSCHRDGYEHCWACEGCRARTESFARAGVQDPLAPSRGTKIT